METNRPDLLSAPGQAALILLLVWVAGSVDALSYLGLGRVFTANMTGNTVLLGLALGQGHALQALRSLAALGGYAAGVAIGALIVQRRTVVAGWTSAVNGALAVELGVLACFTVAFHVAGAALQQSAYLHVLIGLSGMAMGIQSATVRRLGFPGIVTTYITGTLTTLVAGLVSGYQGRRTGPTSPGIERRQTAVWDRRLLLQAGVLVVYACAAMFSTAVQQHWPPLTAYSPLAALLAVLAGAIVLSRRARTATPEI